MIDIAVVIFGLGQEIWMLNPTQITIVLIVSSMTTRACGKRSQVSVY